MSCKKNNMCDFCDARCADYYEETEDCIVTYKQMHMPNDTSDKDQTRLFEPKVGDKFWDTSDPYDKDKCLEIEKMLQQAGFNTRVAQGEDEQWSVVIV